MKFTSPHDSFIRYAFGIAIELLQFICFWVYFAASYYFFRYGNEFGIDIVLSAFGMDKPKIWIWFFITFLYLICFVLLGTISAIASAEHSLHLLASKPEVNEEVRSRKTFFMSAQYYLNKFYLNDGELNFDSKFGVYRSHVTTGFMSINWKQPEQRTIRNFWGLAGRKDINFFQFSERAFITFIEPTDLSKLHHNTEDFTTQRITLNANNFADANLEILVDGRFIRSLKKLFPDNTSEVSDENEYATISLSGRYFFEGNGLNNFRVNNLNLWHWDRNSRKELAVRFDKDHDVQEAMKVKIRSAILEGKST